MAKNLGNLQGGTRQYLDEASQLDFLDTEVNREINHSYHYTIQKVIEVYDDWYDDVSVNPFSYAIVAAQQEYTIDSTIIKPTRVEIDYNANGSSSKTARAIPIKKDEIRGNLANTSTGGSLFSPGYYVRGNIGAQKIGFIPIPQTADKPGNKSIFVWGVTLPVDLVLTTDNVNIPWADNFSQIIEKRAAGVLLRKGQQESAEGARLIAEAELDLVNMQTFLKDRQSDNGQYIEDSIIENIDFGISAIV